MQVHPEPFRGTEVTGQAQRSVRADATLAMDDLVDPPRRNTDF
jgi:hypothetical protein